MMQQVFAVYDSKVKAFLQPFFSQAIGGAVRAFGDEVNTKGSPMNRHAEDFSLHHLGEFDDQTAAFKMLPQPINLGLAASFKEPQLPAPVGVGDSDTAFARKYGERHGDNRVGA